MIASYSSFVDEDDRSNVVNGQVIRIRQSAPFALDAPPTLESLRIIGILVLCILSFRFLELLLTQPSPADAGPGLVTGFWLLVVVGLTD